MNLVETENLQRDFHQGEIVVRALRDITFNIASGEFTALVGPSGSGKTTLLNCIGALDQPTGGRVVVIGKELSEMNGSALAEFRLRELGFVFQAYNLIPVLTALENVEFVLVLRGVSRKEGRERAMHLLEEIGLGDLAHRLPKQLSGGQQQRVAVARALVSRPRIVLADEPTANLDSANASGLLDLMTEMCEKKNTAFLFSTHDPRVMQRARRLIRLRDGSIESDEIQARA